MDKGGQRTEPRVGAAVRFSPGENTALGNVSFLRVFSSLSRGGSSASPFLLLLLLIHALGPFLFLTVDLFWRIQRGTARHLKREDRPKETRALLCTRFKAECTNEIERNAFNAKYPCRFSPIPTLSSFSLFLLFLRFFAIFPSVSSGCSNLDLASTAGSRGG